MEHYSIIGLIHDIRTGYASPQFNMVCDDYFTTVPNDEAVGADTPHGINEATWEHILRTSTEQYW